MQHKRQVFGGNIPKPVADNTYSVVTVAEVVESIEYVQQLKRQRVDTNQETQDDVLVQAVIEEQKRIAAYGGINIAPACLVTAFNALTEAQTQNTAAIAALKAVQAQAQAQSTSAIADLTALLSTVSAQLKNSPKRNFNSHAIDCIPLEVLVCEVPGPNLGLPPPAAVRYPASLVGFDDFTDFDIDALLTFYGVADASAVDFYQKIRLFRRYIGKL